jgi:hypothetical protein
MGIEINKLRDKQSNVAFAFSSKERIDYSKQTIAPILAETGFDVYWVDGSTSDEARALPLEYKTDSKLCEIHFGVRGGADAAIVYSLSLLLDKGYEYIGLVENDVRLHEGWWPRIFKLFDQGKADGLNVGGVSARCYASRIQFPRNGYAIMNDLGAGMALYTREAVEAILNYYRTGTLGEISFLFTYYTGKPTGVPWQIVPGQKGEELPGHPQTGDWFFQPNMIAHGLVALAPTPTMTTNLDGDGPYEPQQTPTKDNPAHNFPQLCARLKEVAAEKNDPVRNIMANYDPYLKNWRAFPHQLIMSLPGCFKGDWKMKWSKSLGPFAMVTGKPGDSLKLNMHGTGFGMMVNSGGKPLTLTIRGTFGEGKLKIAEKEGWQWGNLGFPHSGPYDLEIVFDAPNVWVGYFIFEGPQSWFKGAYNMRYKDLAPFIA